MAEKRAVSTTIYVGRPDLIELGDDVDYEEIDEALAAAAASATEITILGGFYSVGPLVSLCREVKKSKRKTCRIRIAVGLEASAMIPQTWDDMRQLRRDLLDSGFRDVTVAIVDRAPVHFHTKLFRFLHTTRPVWFIGSANPGSGRHELMVRLSGRHEGLSDYVAAVFHKAVDVKEKPPAIEIGTLRDFFLAGMLCHKPPVQRLFTFDAFHFDVHQREVLATALAGSSGVSHASPKTQGFGFNLRSPLDFDGEDPLATESPKGRIQFRPYSVDTAFGWWMPRYYAQEIKDKVHNDEVARERRLAEIGDALRSTQGEATVRTAFQSHIDSMEGFLNKHQIEARSVADRDLKFERFLASRVKALSDPNTIRRHARSLTFAAMPDIWADGSAVEEFESSFFEDVAYRAAGTNQHRVVKSILFRLDDGSLTTGWDIAAAFEASIGEVPWTDNDWEE